nr:MAG TPA: hypothetical protein [Caudoviricetes sp.]
MKKFFFIITFQQKHYRCTSRHHQLFKVVKHGK